MNTIKVQQEIIAELLRNPERHECYHHASPSGEHFIMPDRARGFFIPDEEMMLDAKRLKPLTRVPVSAPLFFDESTRLKATGEYRKRGVTMAVGYKGEHGETWVDTTLLGYFSRTAEYHQSGKNQPVWVVEQVSTTAKRPVGVIMPMNI